MNISRNGKVARLPRAVREELNERLADGETARSVTAWLNGLPVVQGIVATEFGGRGIREQNVSEWKRGGYEDWLLQQEARGVVERFAEGAGKGKRQDTGCRMQEGGEKVQDGGCGVQVDEVEAGVSLTEALVWWVTARLAVEMREIGRVKKSSERWRVFGAMCDRVVKLRRGDHQERRLTVARERLEFERERKRKVTEQEMWAWAMREENRAKIAKGFMSRADKIASIRDAFFADVDAEPEPEFFVRERREKAVALAKEQVREDDPGFEWYVEELVMMLKREDDERCGRRNRVGRSGEGEPPRRQNAKGEVVGEPGGVGLMGEEEWATQRRKDSKEGEKGGAEIQRCRDSKEELVDGATGEESAWRRDERVGVEVGCDHDEAKGGDPANGGVAPGGEGKPMEASAANLPTTDHWVSSQYRMRFR